MSKGFEGTAGPWSVGFGDGITGIRAAASCYWDETGVLYLPVSSGHAAVAYVILASDEDPIAEADARLIAEAGTVLHETGLTPRQLAEQRAELLEALRLLYDELERDHYGEGYAPDPDEPMGIAKSAIANATQQRNATGGDS